MVNKNNKPPEINLSFGDYKIENANIFDCGDKAISFGEPTRGCQPCHTN